jgi:hypothetical protein
LAAADNGKALNAFLATKCKIDAMLARLKALSDDHFETNPDKIDWGNVSTLNHYFSFLREITDSAFSEGEHATHMVILSTTAQPTKPKDTRYDRRSIVGQVTMIILLSKTNTCIILPKLLGRNRLLLCLEGCGLNLGPSGYEPQSRRIANPSNFSHLRDKPLKSQTESAFLRLYSPGLPAFQYSQNRVRGLTRR